MVEHGRTSSKRQSENVRKQNWKCVVIWRCSKSSSFQYSIAWTRHSIFLIFFHLNGQERLFSGSRNEMKWAEYKWKWRVDESSGDLSDIDTVHQVCPKNLSISSLPSHQSANLMDRWLKWITTENTTGPEPDKLTLVHAMVLGFPLGFLFQIELIQERSKNVGDIPDRDYQSRSWLGILPKLGSEQTLRRIFAWMNFPVDYRFPSSCWTSILIDQQSVRLTNNPLAIPIVVQRVGWHQVSGCSSLVLWKLA